MNPLQFLEYVEQNNIPAKELKSLYFEASHTPTFIIYEVCEA